MGVFPAAGDESKAKKLQWYDYASTTPIFFGVFFLSLFAWFSCTGGWLFLQFFDTVALSSGSIVRKCEILRLGVAAIKKYYQSKTDGWHNFWHAVGDIFVCSRSLVLHLSPPPPLFIPLRFVSILIATAALEGG